MKRDKKKPRARTLARLFGRKQDKLIDDRERLAALEPGGSAERPIEIEAASLLPLRAESFDCLRCSGRVRYVEDRVVAHGSELRRAATIECKECGAERELWFRIAARLLN